MIIIMMPVIPHIANECLNSLDISSEIKWPEINQKYLIKSS